MKSWFIYIILLCSWLAMSEKRKSKYHFYCGVLSQWSDLMMSYWDLNKMADILQMKFGNTFSLMKMCISYLYYDFTEVCSKWFNWSTQIQVMAWYRKSDKPLLPEPMLRKSCLKFGHVSQWFVSVKPVIQQKTFIVGLLIGPWAIWLKS